MTTLERLQRLRGILIEVDQLRFTMQGMVIAEGAPFPVGPLRPGDEQHFLRACPLGWSAVDPVLNKDGLWIEVGTPYWTTCGKLQTLTLRHDRWQDMAAARHFFGLGPLATAWLLSDRNYRVPWAVMSGEVVERLEQLLEYGPALVERFIQSSGPIGLRLNLETMLRVRSEEDAGNTD